MTGRQWTEDERAKAIGLGMTRGAIVASKETGIPRRTITRWLASPDAVVLRQESRAQVAEKLWSAVVEGTDAVVAGLRDPKARLGDKASALRIVVEAHALISGGATARTESTNLTVTRSEQDFEDDRHLAEFLDALDAATPEERAAYAPKLTAALLQLPESTDG